MNEKELKDLRGLWLSRLMLNEFVGWAPETRTFEEYVEAVTLSRASREGAQSMHRRKGAK